MRDSDGKDLSLVFDGKVLGPEKRLELEPSKRVRLTIKIVEMTKATGCSFSLVKL